MRLQSSGSTGKTSGSRWPLLDLAEGSVNPAAGGSGRASGIPKAGGARRGWARSRGRTGTESRLGGRGERTGLGGNLFPGTFPRPSSALAGCGPFPAVPQPHPGVWGGRLRRPRPPRTPCWRRPGGPRLCARLRVEPQSRRAGPPGGRGLGGKPEPKPPRSRPSRGAGSRPRLPPLFLPGPLILGTPGALRAPCPSALPWSSPRQS